MTARGTRRPLGGLLRPVAATLWSITWRTLLAAGASVLAVLGGAWVAA